jgi:hypothetical protein
MLEKKIFLFFEPFCARLASKLAKVISPPKKFVSTNFDMGDKNVEFDADFESVDKVVRKFLRKKIPVLA